MGTPSGVWHDEESNGPNDQSPMLDGPSDSCNQVRHINSMKWCYHNGAGTTGQLGASFGSDWLDTTPSYPVQEEELVGVQ